MSLTSDEVDVCNQAFDRIGSKNIAYATQATVNVNEATKAETIYSQTRDALLSAFDWPFARERVILYPTTNTPPFEWDYKFTLPDDYLRLRYNYTTGSDAERDDRQVREGDYLLSNYDEADIVYTRQVTDVTKFDPLFQEVLVLTMAKKLIPALAGTKSPGLNEDVARDLATATSRARAVCRAEDGPKGRSDWNEARWGSGKV